MGAPRSRWEEQPRDTLTAGLPASRTRESNGCCLRGNLLPRHSEPNASGTAALQGHRLCPVRLKAQGRHREPRNGDARWLTHGGPTREAETRRPLSLKPAHLPKKPEDTPLLRLIWCLSEEKETRPSLQAKVVELGRRAGDLGQEPGGCPAPPRLAPGLSPAPPHPPSEVALEDRDKAGPPWARVPAAD